jgi:hypothetical protein
VERREKEWVGRTERRHSRRHDQNLIMSVAKKIQWMLNGKCGVRDVRGYTASSRTPLLALELSQDPLSCQPQP